jgi:exodeoxyribonuclease V gamma subunit
VPPEQAWQPALWRALLAALPAPEQAATRPLLHRRFLQALRPGAKLAGLPQRVVLFGTTHIPHQTLEAIAALAEHVQVLLAVPNPCRYHWADIIDGRELLQAAQRRHPLRAGTELASVPLQEMHHHGHPLLAAWGRQGRDFVRQLDAYDDVQLARQRFAVPRVDYFDDAPGSTLLQRLQAQIRDLVPVQEALAAAGSAPAVAHDRSIVFHIAHSAQREVEVLHDQLLQLLARAADGPSDRPLQPRDIVVMVPDIETFAPAIRAVFGQHPRSHARHIPWGIADQRERGRHPLLLALEWLLRAPQQRHAYSELQGLLEVPALARRFGVAAEDLPTLLAWAEGAGARWGLHEAQREGLGLGACGDANSWHFGLQRLLLGYATGELVQAEGAPGGHAGIEPYAEVAGLSAGLAGALAELTGALQAWWADSQRPRTPAAWGPRLRQLLQDLFNAASDEERALLAALDEALVFWLQACEAAGFEEAVDLPVVREAWLQAVDEPGLARRFRAGGVTFCTLLPLRAIPFKVVCLLGMNDGDYPRRSARSDFDLMALPGQARPGDRSRRDDDRQLMLDALLSARQVLYLSWAGRSVRDNQSQPPSVLVAQLRDHLAAVWGEKAVTARTTEHPLQPFSRRYFEAPAAGPQQALFTYAAEWRSAHETAAAVPAPAPATEPVQALPAVTVDGLATFLKNPVQAYFRQRLQVRFDERPAPVPDDESFATAGLDRWQLMDEVLSAARRGHEAQTSAHGKAPLDLQGLVRAQVARLQRAGRLPLAGPGRHVQAELAATLQPMVLHWQALQAQHPQRLPKRALQLVHPALAAVVFDDWLTGLQSTGEAGATALFIELQASRLADARGKHPRADKLLKAWVRSLAAAACGQPVGGIVIGADVVLHLAPLPIEAARETLLALMAAWAEGLSGGAPLPTAVNTGLALLKGEDAAAAYDGSDYGARGEGREASLARLFPSFAALAAQPGFAAASGRLYTPLRDWLAQQVHIEPLPGEAAGADEADGDE